ncbi:MAG TPA: hypothetical protein VGZ25_00945 [Gemmataceae bacterium]|nr:hypothetical protein [Gemmataceae bacterium]
MRLSWMSLGIVAVGLLNSAGCRNSEANLKPPPNKEVYNLPPADDPRYSGYPTFPKGTLNQEYVKRDKDRQEKDPDSAAKAAMGRFSGGGGGN